MGLLPCHGVGWFSDGLPASLTTGDDVLGERARSSWREPQFHANINQQGDPCHSGQAGADTSQSNQNLRVWSASSKVRQRQVRSDKVVLSFCISIWRNLRHFDKPVVRWMAELQLPSASRALAQSHPQRGSRSDLKQLQSRYLRHCFKKGQLGESCFTIQGLVSFK